MVDAELVRTGSSPSHGVARMNLQLRPYQSQALQAAYAAVQAGQDPCVSLPTASGKSLVIAAMCARLPGRVLCLTHRKELLAQNEAETLAYAGDLETGIVSAGLERREYGARIVFGGIASVYRTMPRLLQHGAFATVLVDEAHAIPLRNKPTSMYAQTFAACQDARRIGLTATPYRLDGGPIYGTQETWFSHLAIDIGIRTLTPAYLAPLKGVLTAHEVDTHGIRIRQGEYVASDLSQAACDEALVEATLTELCALAAKRHKWILYCVDVAHTALVCARLQARGIPSGMVVGTTPSEVRAQTLWDFQTGNVRALVNCETLTTGLNVPAIDCIALLRPSQSKGLIVQMLGRGCRQHASKRDCLVLDFSGSLEKFAPLDAIDSLYRSPERVSADEAKRKKAATRQMRQLTHEQEASLLDPMGDGVAQMARRVEHVAYSVSDSKKYLGKQLLVVRYKLDGAIPWVTSWICLEYPGAARIYAEPWFARRGALMPQTAQGALAASRRYRQPSSVILKRDGQYWRVAMEQFGEEENGADEG